MLPGILSSSCFEQGVGAGGLYSLFLLWDSMFSVLWRGLDCVLWVQKSSPRKKAVA